MFRIVSLRSDSQRSYSYVNLDACSFDHYLNYRQTTNYSVYSVYSVPRECKMSRIYFENISLFFFLEEINSDQELVQTVRGITLGF